VAAAAIATSAASIQFADTQLDPVVARQFSRFGHTLLHVFALRMAAMVVFTTSNMGRAAGILPWWFAVAGFLVGLIMLMSASFYSALALVFPVWLLLSIIMLLKARSIPADIPLPPHAEPR
jgi:hypothetical protein